MYTIYQDFINKKGYTPELQSKIKETVDSLKNNNTSANRPGLLLGKIQSGKTRAFIGIIALAFDEGYDVSIIFTKGHLSLASQTLTRIKKEFDEYISEKDEIRAYDIKEEPKLSGYILEKKLIFVVKKETKNLDKLIKLFDDHPILKNKKILFVDDEADFASIGFKKDKDSEDGITMNVLARKINQIRNNFEQNSSFLQVTATPYSLYLQPSNEEVINGTPVKPVKPSFTVLLPIHKDYVGGREYFEEAENLDSKYSDIYIRVLEKEMEVLKKQDLRYINNVLTSPNLAVMRFSIINYIVGGAIRSIQEENKGNHFYKCSFIIHIDTGKKKHCWQENIVRSFLEKFKDKLIANDNCCIEMARRSYNNLVVSIKKGAHDIPEFNDVWELVNKVFKRDYIGVSIVNSDAEVETLLNSKGQLRLDNPFNIFIGGQILDRGITIDNLIGFFYGRNPKTCQQDTVLQHSRMYGARSSEDMDVTRFYTTDAVYDVLKKINKFDNTLRETFENGISGRGEDGVVFIEKDSTGKIRPCSPTKILITDIQTIKPFSRHLPYGFQTKAKTHIIKIVEEIDSLIRQYPLGKPFLLNIDTAYHIIDDIKSTFEYSELYENANIEWDNITFKKIIELLNMKNAEVSTKNKIFCYYQKNRNMSRLKDNATSFSDAPDSGKEESVLIRETVKNIPCLLLLKQNGEESKGWRNAEFWWPVLVTPESTQTTIFATKTKKN